MKRVFYIIIAIVVISCQKKSNEAVYNIESKSREVILAGNEKYINNYKALELFERGLKEVENKNYIKAKDYFSKANKVEPNNVIINDALATIESSLGNNQKSIEMLYNNLSRDSTTTSTYINLGQNLMLEKKYQDANKILLLGLKNGKNPNLHQKSILLLNLGVSFNNINQCDKGLKFTKEAIDLSQNVDFKKFAEKIALEIKNCK